MSRPGERGRAERDRVRRPAALVEAGVVAAGFLAVATLRFDTLARTPPVAAAKPTVGGALVGTGLLLFATSPTGERLGRDWPGRLVVAAVAVLGGWFLFDAVGDPDATFGLLGFLFAVGAGLVVLRVGFRRR